MKEGRPHAGALAADFLPHTAPFLLLDRILALDETTGRFSKAVASDDPLVAASGVLSPILVIEAMAQGAGLVLMNREPELHARGSAFLAAVDRCEVLAPVRVGDLMIVETTVVRRYGEMARVAGTASVADRPCVRATITLAFVATPAAGS
jgi:3-hydroxymyristoyl/3-hydroxydecanoyl-(acyl carrier protein) dehydratase